jgi:hypothetical protein
MKYYIMNPDGSFYAEPDLLTWARWFEAAERSIGSDAIGKVCVSTVFLGLNHRYSAGAPILFETMIFGGGFDGRSERYCTHAEALEGHKRWLDYIKSGAKPDSQREFSRN